MERQNGLCLLETLVPERDRDSVEETFNEELLMQQISKGIPDLERLANWLSALLKKLCAPMRDDLVDLMATQLSTGGYNLNINLIIDGISLNVELPGSMSKPHSCGHSVKHC
ncbi:T-complex protein 11-domain-containing protein [Xylogone sp. PMI_703]|nr:T-complex protein 11-domain-containing protein [Xylogone sp. PMI_703]KAH8800800.1 T-complex protein 11-domain-containing protein [Xylogone sp. PMI_703]